MKAINLSKSLINYKKGWVAINNKNKVVAHAETFKDITKKIFGLKDKVTLMPATSDYSRYIT